MKAYPDPYPSAYSVGGGASELDYYYLVEMVTRYKAYARTVNEQYSRPAKALATPAPAPVVVPAAPAPAPTPKVKAKRRSRTESTDTLAWWMKWGDGISDNEPREMTLPCYEFELSTDAPFGASDLLRFSGLPRREW
jgi:hypothetical protein